MVPKLKKWGIYRGIIPFVMHLMPRKIREKLVVKYYKKIFGGNPYPKSIKGSSGNKDLDKMNAYYRIKHRIRVVEAYFYAEPRNLLVVGAANKTEHLIGYYVKYGIDHTVDISPIQHLYKRQIYEMAKYLDVPMRIQKKKPRPDILPGITDEFAIGMSFEKIDMILRGIELRLSKKEIMKQAKVNEKEFDYLNYIYKNSEHMRTFYYLK